MVKTMLHELLYLVVLSIFPMLLASTDSRHATGCGLVLNVKRPIGVFTQLFIFLNNATTIVWLLGSRALGSQKQSTTEGLGPTTTHWD